MSSANFKNSIHTVEIIMEETALEVVELESLSDIFKNLVNDIFKNLVNEDTFMVFVQSL